MRTCEDCGKIYTTRSALCRHRASAHLGKTVGNCPKCGKTFKRKFDLKNHINRDNCRPTGTTQLDQPTGAIQMDQIHVSPSTPEPENTTVLQLSGDLLYDSMVQDLSEYLRENPALVGVPHEYLCNTDIPPPGTTPWDIPPYGTMTQIFTLKGKTLPEITYF